jgi:hypothetical protein
MSSLCLQGERIHKLLTFDPPIHAFDQDIAIDAPIRYDIIAGKGFTQATKRKITPFQKF